MAPVLPRAVTASCWRGATASPVRIEATPEETAVIEWRPGRH